jgi:hypothetical protein
VPLAGAGVTVAVKVTSSPNSDGLPSETTLVVVSARHRAVSVPVLPTKWRCRERRGDVVVAGAEARDRVTSRFAARADGDEPKSAVDAELHRRRHATSATV